MDSLREPIGRPPTRVSLRKNSPPDCFSSTHPAFRFAGDFAPCGERRGLLALDLARALPLNPASLSRKAGSKAFNFLRQYAQLSCAKMFSTISFILSSPKSSRSISTVEILV